MVTHYTFLARLFDYSDSQIKVIAIFSFLMSAMASMCQNFLGVSFGLFIALFFIMIIDYITGLRAAKKEERDAAERELRPIRKIFSSKKGLNWVFKFGSYSVFLYVSNSFNLYIQQIDIQFATVIMKLIHFYILIHIFNWEIKSVDENLERLGVNFKILKLWDSIFAVYKHIAQKKMNKEQ